MSQEASEDEDLNSETDVELDENDNKIIQLYDIINELVDDQAQRVDDLKLLYEEQTDEVLQNVEDRNNSLLNQVFSDLQLKETKDEEDDEDEEDSEGMSPLILLLLITNSTTSSSLFSMNR